MDSQKVDLFLVSNQKYFEPGQILLIKDRLLALDDDKFALICSLDYKDPTTLLLISIFIGGLGIDRFMLGDTGLGVLKLLTGGPAVSGRSSTGSSSKDAHASRITSSSFR